MPTVPPVPPDEPAWRTQAAALEQIDRLEEAEKIIGDAIPTLHFAIATAEMYRQRWRRLLQAGDPARARVARKKAADWAYFYASQATSGGEGMALSQERDQFLHSLGREPIE